MVSCFPRNTYKLPERVFHAPLVIAGFNNFSRSNRFRISFRRSNKIGISGNSLYKSASKGVLQHQFEITSKKLYFQEQIVGIEGLMVELSFICFLKEFSYVILSIKVCNIIEEYLATV